MNKVDLTELSKRESERVEWKANVADIEDVIKTAVAFANDYSNLGGGYIVCGAKEAKDEHGFQKLIQTGLTSNRLKEIEGKVLSDLRDSGAIEQDADIIALLYRDEYYNRDSNEKGICEILIGKNRNGKTGMFKLNWIPEIQRFVDI